MGRWSLGSDRSARIDAFLGIGVADGLLARDAPSGTAEGPVESRLRDLEALLLQHIDVVIAHAEELADPDYLQQARGEVTATLIVLRELWRRFPELLGSM